MIIEGIKLLNWNDLNGKNLTIHVSTDSIEGSFAVGGYDKESGVMYMLDEGKYNKRCGEENENGKTEIARSANKFWRK